MSRATATTLKPSACLLLSIAFALPGSVAAQPVSEGEPPSTPSGPVSTGPLTSDEAAANPSLSPTLAPAGPEGAKVPASTTGSCGGARIALKTAIGCALDRNPSVLQARRKYEEQDILRAKAISGLFPQISLNGQGLNKKDSVLLGSQLFDGNSYNVYNVYLQGTQTLYQFGALSAIEVQNQNQRIQRLQVEITERTITQQVLQSFYSLLLDQASLDSLLESKKVLVRALAVVTRYKKIGRNQLLDVLQAKTQLALVAPQIETARNQLRADAATLANLMGAPDANEVGVRGKFDFPSPDVIRARVKPTGTQLPEYEQQLATLDQIEAQRAATLGSDLPQLSLTGTYGHNAFTQTDLIDTGSTYWAAGLQLTIPLFSGLSSVHTRDDFTSQTQQAELGRQNVANNLALAQVKSLQSAEVTYAEIRPSLVAYRLAAASLREAERMIRIATINYLQLYTIEQAYFTAMTALNQARYNYVNNLVSYFVATGLPLDRLTTEIEEYQRK